MNTSTLPAATINPEPSQTVTLGEVEFTLLGTAHISHRSAREVVDRLSSGEYDGVALELCPPRYQHLTRSNGWEETDLFQVIRAGKAGTFAAHLALSAYQKRLANQLGVQPGAEMKAAIDTATGRNLPIWCIDRDVGITLKRLFRKVPWTQRFSLLCGLLGTSFSRATVSESEIERLKEGDWLENTFAEFAARSPALYGCLIQERDRYMAARLRQESQRGGPLHMLVVIGAGHLTGVANQLRRPDPEDPSAEIAELEQYPAKSRWTHLLPWLVVAAILAGFGVGFSRSTALGWHLVLEWVLINGTLSALGAAIAAAHPLTVIGAFLASPLTSLNPTIGAGMVTAALETGLRRPRVADFSNLRDQVTQVSGWWHNRVAHILLVSILSTLGSAIGTYVAGFRIIKQLI